MKKLVSVFLAVLIVLSFASTALAREQQFQKQEEVMNFSVTDQISFVLYKDNVKEGLSHGSINPAATTKYTSDSYSGYFYWPNTGNKISEHKFTAYFSYDGTMASCYDKSSSVKMIDNSSNYRPKAINEGKNNVSSSQVYGYVTFVLYDPNDNASAEVSIKIYCNQKGETWVNRQG